MRAATSEGTKRRETKKRQLYQPAHFPHLGRKWVSQYFYITSKEHPVQGSGEARGLLKPIKTWKMVPGKSDVMRLKPAQTDRERVPKWSTIVSKQMLF